MQPAPVSRRALRRERSRPPRPGERRPAERFLVSGPGTSPLPFQAPTVRVSAWLHLFRRILFGERDRLDRTAKKRVDPLPVCPSPTQVAPGDPERSSNAPYDGCSDHRAAGLTMPRERSRHSPATLSGASLQAFAAQPVYDKIANSSCSHRTLWTTSFFARTNSRRLGRTRIKLSCVAPPAVGRPGLIDDRADFARMRCAAPAERHPCCVAQGNERSLPGWARTPINGIQSSNIKASPDLKA